MRTPLIAGNWKMNKTIADAVAMVDTLVPLVEGVVDRVQRVLLALTGPDTPQLSPVALLRATLAAAEKLPAASVVAVPLASHGDPAIEHDVALALVPADRRATLIASPDKARPSLWRFDVRLQGPGETVFFDA